jgi:transposase
MAPNLAESQHAEIRDMILSKSLNALQMAKVAGCSDRSVQAIRSNLCYFGSTKAPSNCVGRPRSVTPPMLDALCERLLEKTNLYQDEMAIFLWDEFEVLVTTFSIGRALAPIGWTKKAARRVAKGRNADLRDFYLHNLSTLRSYHLVYMDESGCDKCDSPGMSSFLPFDQRAKRHKN